MIAEMIGRKVIRVTGINNIDDANWGNVKICVITDEGNHEFREIIQWIRLKYPTIKFIGWGEGAFLLA
jgi:hypothetical protein